MATMRGHFAARNDDYDREHIALCEVPAPAFGEGPRGDHLAERFAAFGRSTGPLLIPAPPPLCARNAPKGRCP